MLIVLEGSEGVGKTTQLRRLSEWFAARGAQVVAVREPGGTILGDEIRRLLLDPESDITPRAEALLFMASRAQLVEREIRPALERGAVVLLDRFFLSTYAYQGAGRGLPDDSVRAANQLAAAGLVPDLTLLLVLDAGEGLERAGARGAHDRMERAERAFHERVARAFSEFAQPDWQRAHPECGLIVAVDATGTPDDVFARVVREVEARWPASSPNVPRSDA
jgi:dTMP kinase